MKKLLLSLGFWIALTSGALAQNVTCPTRPTGDSSNACASTAFVATGFVAGPGSSVVGDVALWANTAGTRLSDYGGTTATSYPYNYSSSLFTGTGLANGPGPAFLNQNNVWNTSGVYPAIWNSTAPWAAGRYKSCIGTLSDTTGSGTCTPGSTIGLTYGVNISGYTGAPGAVTVTATTTSAATTAAALCTAIRAATLNTQIVCDPNVYGGAGYFNITWAVSLNGSVSMVATGTGTTSLTNPSNKNNLDLVAYQFNHTVSGYSLQAGDGPLCLQGFAQQTPLFMACTYVQSVGPITASTNFYSVVGGTQYDVFNIGNGILLPSSATGGAGLTYKGLGTITLPTDGGYYVGENYSWTKSGTTSLFSTASTGSPFEFQSSANNVMGINMVPTGTLDVAGTVSALSAANPTTGSGVSLIGGGSNNSVVSLNWGTGAWQALEFAALTMNFDPSQSATSGWQMTANVFNPRANNATTLGTASLAPSTVYGYHLNLRGATSGSVDQTAPAIAGSAAIAWGTGSGTPAVTATAPLAISSTTGNITCTGCLTNTPAALTKTDDTNITLTLGGTPATALLQATSLTLGWTGQLSVARGGTGIASGTSGGIPYFSGSTTIASSGVLSANAIVIGGGAGVAPSTTTTGTGVLTALGVNVGTAGAFVVNGGALGTPSSGVGTNLTGTASGLTAGNVTTNANLTGPITSVGNATSITSQTGTGTKFVVDTSPTIITPTFTTSATTPLLIGGTAAGSILTLEPTSNGSPSGDYALLTSAGATGLYMGKICAGTTSLVGFATGNAGQSDCTHYNFMGDGSNAYFNAPTGGTVYFRVNNASFLQGTATSLIASVDTTLNTQMFVPNITTSSAAQTGTVCWTTGTGKFTADTTVGCLTSLLAAKNVLSRPTPITMLDIATKLSPISFRYKDGWGDSGHYEQFGLGAEEVAKVDERLVGRDPEGNLQGVRYQELTAVLVGAIQQLKTANDNLEARVKYLEAR